MDIKLALCSTQRTTLVQMRKFIEYHQSLEFDRIYIFFDDPHDENIKQATAYSSVKAIICNEDYWQEVNGRPDDIENRQRKNAMFALGLARKEGVDWLIHMDVDEFFHPAIHECAKHYFESLDNAAVSVRFPSIEAIPTALEHDNFLNEINEFRCFPLSYKKNVKMLTRCKFKLLLNNIGAKTLLFVLGLLGFSKYFKYGHMKAYTAGKGAVKTSANIISIGIHSSRIKYEANQHTQIENQASILHFDGFSYKAWKEKWLKRLGGTGKSIAMHSERQQQLEDFKVAFKSGSEDRMKRLYQKIYYIENPNHKRIIKFFGLIKRI